jgi:hypothetical protein
MRGSSRAVAVAVAVAVALSACGYRPASSAHDPLGPFEVAAAPVTVPDGATVMAAVGGARAELARRGVLGGCDAAPSRRCAEVRVAVTRVEESPAGIAAGGSDDAAALARGVRVTVTGSAQVTVAGEARRATGEVSASEVVSVGGGPAAATLARDDAARAAAARLGVRLARLLLGHPEPMRD